MYILYLYLFIYLLLYLYIFIYYISTPDYIPIHHVMHVECGNKALLLFYCQIEILSPDTYIWNHTD